MGMSNALQFKQCTHTTNSFISVGNRKAGISRGNNTEGQLIKLLAQAIVAQARRQVDAAKVPHPRKSSTRGGPGHVEV
jgi:hypothetical protein